MPKQRIEFTQIYDGTWSDINNNVTVQELEDGSYRVSNRYKFKGYDKHDRPIYDGLSDGSQDKVYADKITAFNEARQEVVRFRSRL